MRISMVRNSRDLDWRCLSAIVHAMRNIPTGNSNSKVVLMWPHCCFYRVLQKRHSKPKGGELRGPSEISYFKFLFIYSFFNMELFSR